MVRHPQRLGDPLQRGAAKGVPLTRTVYPVDFMRVGTALVIPAVLAYSVDQTGRGGISAEDAADVIGNVFRDGVIFLNSTGNKERAPLVQIMRRLSRPSCTDAAFCCSEVASS